MRHFCQPFFSCRQTSNSNVFVSGIGEVKACRYGEDFLKAIRDYKQGKA